MSASASASLSSPIINAGAHAFVVSLCVVYPCVSELTYVIRGFAIYM